jgi:adenylate cyclase
MATDLFISHCTADREQADAVRAACEAQGLTCWIAPRDILPGTAWADAIVDGIAGASAVVVIHSRSAGESPMVRREVDAAAAARKPIIPVRIDDALPQQGMQFYLSSTHWFDAPPPLENHLERLVESLLRLLRAGDDGIPKASLPLFPEFDGHPAIAVLPFRAYAAEDEAFADGLVDELTNALSRWRIFPVIARHSAFAYRGRDMDVRMIGRELGARYLVTGTLRRRDQLARVNLDLVDVQTGESLITERYEKASDDQLAMQDELVHAIAAVLGPEVMKQERERAALRPPSSRDVYDLYERGMWHRYRNTREDLEAAQRYFRQALEIDPHYARATAALSLCYNFAATSRWVPDVPAAYAESLALARSAVMDDPRDPNTHFALGVACMNARRLPDALTELEAAVQLNPSFAFAHANLGQVLNYLNRPEEGLEKVELALRLNPHDPRRFMWLPYVATSHYLARRYTACLKASEQALLANPEFPLAVRYLVAALGQLGRTAEAKPLLPLLRRYDKDLAGLEALTRLYFVPAAAEHLLEGFRCAGFS